MTFFSNSAKTLVIGLVASFVFSIFVLTADRVSNNAGLGFSSSAVYAQNANKQKPRKLPGISDAFFKQMGKVQPLISPDTEKNPDAKPDFNAALKQLKSMEKRCKDKCNKYELSQIYRFYGFAYYSLDDLEKAIYYYDLVVKQSPEIPLGVEKQTLYSLAQLAYSIEKYDQAIAYLNKWIKLSTDISADVYYLQATIYYQKGDKNNSLKSINKAISIVEGRGKIAKENWYNIKRAVLLEKEDFKAVVPLVELLVRHYPKKSYWVQLGGLYGVVGRSSDQLHAFDATYLMGGLTKEQEIVNLSYLYIGEEAPYRAAKVLTKGMKDKIVKKTTKNLETLATAWGTAKEHKKAVEVLKEAAEVSKTEPLKNPKKDKRRTGDIYTLMSGYYLDLDDSKNAVDAGKNALKAGQLKDAGLVHSNMGIAYVDLKQFKSAIAAFDKAMQTPKHRKFAANWKKFAEGELKRQEALAI